MTSGAQAPVRSALAAAHYRKAGSYNVRARFTREAAEAEAARVAASAYHCPICAAEGHTPADWHVGK